MKWELGSKTVAVDFQLAGALSAPELQVQRREGEKEEGEKERRREGERDSNRDNYSGALSRHTHALWERTAAHQPSVVHTSFT